ncbi:NUDIX hydrolase [Streptomyces corynorhini]|uniref:NUDIX domain-containing protein n=1 Tax=Streptomyces corynorhini TaxID=2282652 RepID=A0A370BDG9_9ACTN|nr:NUDIX domain-containing protein [Streptomyces corynorhini]RDG38439.1 NUDIX domain-containing protein [Streptomyces corynorhini]
MRTTGRPIAELLERYAARDATEAADVARVLALVRTAADPWLRTIPLHVTASALIVHPGSGRVLMRHHPKLGTWLQVGGHGDPGESLPVEVALREAREETGLADLVPYPDAGRATLVQVVVVPVPAGGGEPAHEHADLRFALATAEPGSARPERPEAPLRWMTPAEAREATAEANVREGLRRVERSLTATGPARPAEGATSCS